MISEDISSNTRLRRHHRVSIRHHRSRITTTGSSMRFSTLQSPHYRCSHCYRTTPEEMMEIETTDQRELTRQQRPIITQTLMIREVPQFVSYRDSLQQIL